MKKRSKEKNLMRLVLLVVLGVTFLAANIVFAQGDQGVLDWAVYDQLLHWETMGPEQVPTVTLTVFTKGNATPDQIKALKEAGFEVTGHILNMIEIKGSGKAVKNLKGLNFLSNVSFPVEWENTDTNGSSLQTAMAACQVDKVQSEGYTGKGVKIAVIQQGGFTGELANTLARPPHYYQVEYDPVNDSYSLVPGRLEGAKENVVHGTACAEIVAKIAPQATLYLISTDSSNPITTYAGIALAASGLHTDIISFSMENAFPLDHGDASSDVAKWLDGLISKYDVLFVRSAGNDALTHYNGNFADSDGNQYHNFSNTGDVFNDNTLHIRAYGGYSWGAVLEWNNWSTPISSRQDLDLEIYDSNHHRILATHTRQCNAAAIPPVESNLAAPVIIHVPEGAGWVDYYIAVQDVTQKVCGRPSQPVDFNLWVYGGVKRPIEDDVPKYSTLNTANAHEVLTVGGVAYDSSNSTFVAFSPSSWGPTFDGRIKPDIVAPTGVYSPAYGHVFWGTSASAPFAAGCAALVLQASEKNSPSLGKSLTHDQIISILRKTAKDIGPTGDDPQYGWGVINAEAAVQEAIRESSQ